MKPETLKDVIRALPCDGATTVAFLGALPVALLDATVYRSCPECGASRKCQRCDGEGKWFYELELAMIDCDDCKGTGTCPACADAPTAIVSAALREKATCCELGLSKHLTTETQAKGLAGVTGAMWEVAQMRLDAILSTVLGRPVRYAKEVWCLSVGGEVWPTCKESRWLGRGDTIAILEEAGKEE